MLGGSEEARGSKLMSREIVPPLLLSLSLPLHKDFSTNSQDQRNATGLPGLQQRGLHVRAKEIIEEISISNPAATCQKISVRIVILFLMLIIFLLIIN